MMARVAYAACLCVVLVGLVFGAPTPTESPTVSPSQGPTVTPTTSPTISVVPVINTCPGVDQSWPELVVDGSFERVQDSGLAFWDWQKTGLGNYNPNDVGNNDNGRFVHSGSYSAIAACWPSCNVNYPPDGFLSQNITASPVDLVCYASFWVKCAFCSEGVDQFAVYVIDENGADTELYSVFALDGSPGSLFQPVCVEWNSTDSYTELLFTVTTEGGWFLDDVSIKCDTGIPPPPAPIRTPAPTPAPTVDNLALGLGLGFGLPLALVLLIVLYCRFVSQSAVSYSAVSK